MNNHNGIFEATLWNCLRHQGESAHAAEQARFCRERGDLRRACDFQAIACGFAMEARMRLMRLIGVE